MEKDRELPAAYSGKQCRQDRLSRWRGNLSLLMRAYIPWCWARLILPFGSYSLPVI